MQLCTSYFREILIDKRNSIVEPHRVVCGNTKHAMCVCHIHSQRQNQKLFLTEIAIGASWNKLTTVPSTLWWFRWCSETLKLVTVYDKFYNQGKWRRSPYFQLFFLRRANGNCKTKSLWPIFLKVFPFINLILWRTLWIPCSSTSATKIRCQWWILPRRNRISNVDVINFHPEEAANKVETNTQLVYKVFSFLWSTILSTMRYCVKNKTKIVCLTFNRSVHHYSRQKHWLPKRINQSLNFEFRISSFFNSWTYFFFFSNLFKLNFRNWWTY